MNLHEDLLTIEGHCKWPYRGKLLALKRCIGNLVDNGIKYGQKVRIIIMDDEEMLILFIMDEGPVCRTISSSASSSPTTASAPMPPAPGWALASPAT